MSDLLIKSSRRPELYELTAERVGPGDITGAMPPRLLIANGHSNPTLPERLLRILVADASLDMRSIIRAYLRGTPYRLEEAENSNTAVKKFKLGRFDFVLLESNRALIDSYSAVREMRDWEMKQGLPRTPVVGLIPSAVEEDGQQPLNDGWDDRIRQPLCERSLVDAIQAWNSPVDPMALREMRVFDTPDEESLLGALIAQFLSDLDPRLSAIRKAFSARDARNLRFTLHALRGSCGNFGAQRMARLCAYLERGNRGEIDANSYEVVTEIEIESMHVRLALVAQPEWTRGVESRAAKSMRQEGDAVA